MTRGWWRRNAVALCALAVVVPATAAALTLPAWNDRHGALPSVPVTADAGDRVEFSGDLWGPATAEWAPATADGIEAPDGARVLEVTVPVSPDDPPASCAPPILREDGGDGRQWNDTRPFSSFGPGGATSCDADADAPYTIVVSFILPDDAAGPFVVDIAPAEELPRFLRLPVAP
ncbi:hypothetical protein [Microbacterium sp. 18062]|uniref:hypothetical protein n=1 Tax=Microbacterium sp. 18062 TaxID=2681410 RepID=UPI00135ABB4D|nr:hypothetical protein [Microbacterium sp. 18062]